MSIELKEPITLLDPLKELQRVQQENTRLRDEIANLKEQLRKTEFGTTLNKTELERYTGLNKNTLDKYFLRRDDAPVLRIEKGILVHRPTWDEFESAVMMGKRYGGHRDVIYEEM